MVKYEIRYLLVAPLSLFLLLQFILLAWLDKRLPRWAFSPLIVVFVAQDVAYNLSIATWLFWERPQEWLVTTRLKRMVEDPRIERVALVLNHYDEGHV